jgi:hypothetical protein
MSWKTTSQHPPRPYTSWTDYYARCPTAPRTPEQAAAFKAAQAAKVQP